jgi:MoaA/NifB/PqqE/SkfB family radical SAM enzyme
MTFCYSPWTNIDIDPQGTIAPCCKFQTQFYKEHYNIQSHTLKQYTESDFLTEIKNEFEQGKWPAGCERCKIEEQNSIKSKRNLDFDRWHKFYQTIDLKYASVITASIAFGNTCNLKCITCSPYSSSRWQKEYETVYGINVLPVKFYKKDFVQDFISQASDIMHLDIPGGEPFLSGIVEQQHLLQHYVDSGTANKISLHYTTNVTVFPDANWWELWRHFKEVDIQLSIDGIGNRYEYIRYPAKWHDVEQNTLKYLDQARLLNNIKLSVSHTVSAYNIYYLDEFFSWCYNIGLPTPWLGRVHTPSHMRPEVWGANVKELIVENLQSSSHKDIIKWAELIKHADESVLFDNFKKFLHQHDRYRNTNFANTFPELAPYI